MTISVVCYLIIMAGAAGLPRLSRRVRAFLELAATLPPPTRQEDFEHTFNEERNRCGCVCPCGSGTCC